MSRSLLLASLLLAGPPPSSEYQYAVASLEAPNTATAAQLLGAWHALTLERSLAPDLVDHRDDLALGDWLNRPHVCQGRIRYHAALLAAPTLRVLVIAECRGVGQGLDRAAQGLADELGKRISAKGPATAVPVSEVPERFWQARQWRGNNAPPSSPLDPK